MIFTRTVLAFLSAIQILGLFFIHPVIFASGFPVKQPYIPDSLLDLYSGYAVVIDKEVQKLYVFRKTDSIVKVFEMPCSTGKKSGGKQEPGDAKTPNGIYFVQKYYKGDELTPIYGPLAFHLDFPNVIDRRYGRNGTNIWIHGTNKTLQPFQSNGCIALRNEDIGQLAGYIFLNKTPIIIQESVKWVPQNEKNSDRTELERIMYTWDRAINRGDVKTLTDLYIPDSRDVARQQTLFKKATHLQSLMPHLQMYPRDVTILKEGDTAVILFDKIISAKSDGSFQGEYIRLALERKDNRWSIVEDIKPEQILASRGNEARKEVKEKAPSQLPKVAAQVKAPPVPSSQRLPATVQVAAAPVAQKKALPPPPAEKQPPPPKPVETKVAIPEPQEKEKTATDKAKGLSDKAIVQLVEKWAESWAAGNMTTYRSCFSSDFKSKGMGLDRYVDYKASLAHRYKKITVHVSNIKIDYDGDRQATVTFIQRYSAAGGLKTTGVKKMQLKQVKDSWKISREVMSK